MRRYFFSFLLILLLASWVGRPASGASTADELAPTGSTEMPFTLALGDATYSTWTNGAFVFVQGRFSAAPLLRFVNRDGTQVSEFKFSIPGASLINIYDNLVALGMDDALAIAGTVYSDDSRAGMFVAWVSPDRKQQTVIRTSPFFPAAMTIASDGTIWVAGHETRQEGEKRDYSRPLIRHYDKTGKLLGSFLPWLTLDTTVLPYPGSILLPLKDHVLWFSPRSQMYFEFSADGSVINRFKSAPHPEHDLTHVAVCDDGRIFASTTMWDNSGTQTHWGIFALDQQRGEWTLVPKNERWGVLFGCDGTRLASTTDFKTISWLDTKAN